MHGEQASYLPISSENQGKEPQDEKTSNEEDTSYADTFFGFEDIEQNDAVVNLLVLLLQNINEKIDVENERTSSILRQLQSVAGNNF